MAEHASVGRCRRGGSTMGLRTLQRREADGSTTEHASVQRRKEEGGSTMERGDVTTSQEREVLNGGACKRKDAAEERHVDGACERKDATRTRMAQRRTMQAMQTFQRRKEKEKGSTAERASVRRREDEECSTVEHADITTPQGGEGGLNVGACKHKTPQMRGGGMPLGLRGDEKRRAETRRDEKGAVSAARRHRDRVRKTRGEEHLSTVELAINHRARWALYPQQMRWDRARETRRGGRDVKGAVRGGTGAKLPRKMGAVSAARCAGIGHARRDGKGTVHGQEEQWKKRNRNTSGQQ
ncbi:hypothetical protein C8R47DRAFT_1063184 [Mycena vitilis]|nr:hypothetical protein C8R47DRAFT_1063184 [Mycena vitilis]